MSKNKNLNVAQTPITNDSSAYFNTENMESENLPQNAYKLGHKEQRFFYINSQILVTGFM